MIQDCLNLRSPKNNKLARKFLRKTEGRKCSYYTDLLILYPLFQLLFPSHHISPEKRLDIQYNYCVHQEPKK